MKTQQLFRTFLAIVFACCSFQYSFSQTSDWEKEIAEANQSLPVFDETLNIAFVQFRLLPQGEGVIVDMAFDGLSSAPYKLNYWNIKRKKTDFKKSLVELVNVNPTFRKYINEYNIKIIYRIHDYEIGERSLFKKEDLYSDIHDYFDIVITKNDLKKRN